MERLKLKGRIVEQYGSVKRFADANNITPQYVNLVLKGKTTPRALSLVGWCHVLGITDDDIGLFFCPVGLENQTEA